MLTFGGLKLAIQQETFDPLPFCFCYSFVFLKHIFMSSQVFQYNIYITVWFTLYIIVIFVNALHII
jgi:hypothetical protein